MNFIAPERIGYLVEFANLVNWSTMLICSLVGICLLIYIKRSVSNA